MGRDRRVRTLSVAAGGLVASVVLAACTRGAPATQPDPPEPSEPSASQAPSDEPTAEPTDEPTQLPVAKPEMPAAATKPTLKGAEAFVEYYVELMNYAKATGVSDHMLANAAGCQGCANFAGLYETTVEEGGFFEGAEWSVRVAVALPGKGSTLDVLTTVDIAPGKYKEASNTIVRVLEENSLEFRITVSRDKQGWLVNEFASTDA